MHHLRNRTSWRQISTWKCHPISAAANNKPDQVPKSLTKPAKACARTRALVLAKWQTWVLNDSHTLHTPHFRTICCPNFTHTHSLSFCASPRPGDEVELRDASVETAKRPRNAWSTRLRPAMKTVECELMPCNKLKSGVQFSVVWVLKANKTAGRIKAETCRILCNMQNDLNRSPSVPLTT